MGTGGVDICSMSSHFNLSRSNSLLYWKKGNGLDTTGFHSIPYRQLSVNVLALLCLWALISRTGSPAFSASYDAAAVLAVVCLRNRHATLNEISSHFRPGESIQKALSIGAIAVAGFLFLNYSRDTQGLSSDSSDSSNTLRNAGLQPRMFPCRTTHTRLLPKIHSFSYSYLYAGIPVGWKGSANTLLAADTFGSASQYGNLKFRKTWFSVEGSDHLQRTCTGTDLLQKLQSYLDSQGIAPQLYPYVYLVTAPRFLGFSFNPVSFWYLYSEQKRLAAMILEVNNTFDERRMYFMEQTNAQDRQDSTEKDIFIHSWEKDFHVSPFNERGGHYTLKASDPFAPDMCGKGHIDNTITLSSSNGRPKVVARVFSAQPAILASIVNRPQALRFVCRWWWVGFMTKVRIVREARKLWMKNLEVFYRPEVMKTSIGRKATAEENILAENFLKFLQYVQRHSSGGCSVHYTAAAGKTLGIPITIVAADDPTGGAPDPEPVADLHILTPAFYSSIIQYSDVAEGLKALCLSKPENERLAVLSDANMLLRQIAAVASDKAESLPPETLRQGKILEAARKSLIWRALALLLSATPPTSSSPQPSLIDLAVFSSDASAGEDSWQYSQAVISLLLAKKLALGSTGLLRFYKNVLRFILLWLVAARLQAVVLTLHETFAI